MDILENREAWTMNFRAGWLATAEATGKLDWKRYQRPANAQPVSGKAIDLRRARLVLISSAGAYLPASQAPFDAPNPYGDYTIRSVPVWSPISAIAYAHEHYDHAAVDLDPDVLIPIRRLDEMVSTGDIGALADDFISFGGYQPDLGRVIDETIPAIVREVKALGADAALLVPA
jgi:D-proline reductase (dithiol) PrdB